MSQVSTRLVRMLNMVPYFQANPKVTRDEAAAALGVTRKQLDSDLEQLWMCGLPGYSPGDLIDFDFEGDTVEVTFSAGVDRPLRLTSTEATGILVALRSLVDVPGMVDPEAARSAIAKIESAAGTQRAALEESGSEESVPQESGAAAAVRAAVRDARALTLEYYSASRDSLTTRTVDPIRVVLIGDNSYLEAWCRTAEAVRMFRFDRIVAAERLADPSAPPSPAVQAGTDTSLFDPDTADPSLPSATLLIDCSASWMFDYYPLRVVNELPDGACEAVMTYASLEWMARFLLGFGSAVRVLDPPDLAQRVQESAGEALRVYDAVVPHTYDADDTRA
ncbi:protein pafC [Mycolicibacterium peregrinum]|uniref:helix-turn-helix transcriptional regulator n=1 Tax=Mycolicibacterium peregrinum TaxID=43304 RepID=UPI000A160668|nr:YafY family protein [Mycolicibacterium peregrinum]MCV7203213.1 YafY family transcriptional regulator [Mycolicibacterium peregrinum]ORW53369.1 protein pafC [Mycolicibacterium peregrinum]OWM09600.1 protein pafC [Mycolicibacterium peregrinum]